MTELTKLKVIEEKPSEYIQLYTEIVYCTYFSTVERTENTKKIMIKED